jgi:hypothetical protein
VGAGVDRATVAFVGWFGPRGLASVIFALIALEELHGAADRAVAVVGTTVLLSVLAHGLSAKPLAARYGASYAHGEQPTLPLLTVICRSAACCGGTAPVTAGPVGVTRLGEPPRRWRAPTAPNRAYPDIVLVR